MSYPEAHIMYIFQTPKHSLPTGEHVCGDLPGTWSRSVLRLVEFDRHLCDENPNENIDETYLCGQK